MQPQRRRLEMLRFRREVGAFLRVVFITKSFHLPLLCIRIYVRSVLRCLQNATRTQTAKKGRTLHFYTVNHSKREEIKLKAAH